VSYEHIHTCPQRKKKEAKKKEIYYDYESILFFLKIGLDNGEGIRLLARAYASNDEHALDYTPQHGLSSNKLSSVQHLYWDEL